MTRSNKKKFPHKPPAKHSTTNSTNQLLTITESLMNDERQKMISRSIISAKYHGMNLKKNFHCQLIITEECGLQTWQTGQLILIGTYIHGKNG